MSFDPEIQRFASRMASWLAVPSWAGFAYTLLQRPHHVNLGAASASVPDVGFPTVATLICSLLAFECALSTLYDELASLAGWVFVIFCALPFLGMLTLLDPFGAGSSFR